MRFTKEQYESAIQDLKDGLTQLEPNGHGCHICGDSGHQAFECGSNPLYAIMCCRAVTKTARELHDKMHAVTMTDGDIPWTAISALYDELHHFLHYLGGDNTWMGETYGPAKVKPLDPPEIPKG